MNRRRRTVALLTATALAHGALLAWLNLQAPRTSLPREGPSLVVGLFDPSILKGSAPSPEPAAAAKVAQPGEAKAATEMPAADSLDSMQEITVDPTATSLSAVSFTADPIELGSTPQASSAPAGGGAGETCGLESKLAGVLQSDPVVRSAVAAIPNKERSVSNAVMLWNGRWMLLGGAGQPIRAAVTAFVDAAPAWCQEETVSGPMLLTIVSEPKSTILVVGSGLWRWSDLLRETAPA